MYKIAALGMILVESKMYSHIMDNVLLLESSLHENIATERGRVFEYGLYPGAWKMKLS